MRRTESLGPKTEKKVRIAAEKEVEGTVGATEHIVERSLSASPGLLGTDRQGVRANDVLRLKLVGCPSDFDDPLKEFTPTYTHQLFNDERISGYVDPVVHLFASASSLFFYLKMHYQKKADDAEPVLKNISDRIEGQWTESKAVFLKVCGRERVCV